MFCVYRRAGLGANRAADHHFQMLPANSLHEVCILRDMIINALESITSLICSDGFVMLFFFMFNI